MSDAKETAMQGTAIAPVEPDRNLVLSSSHIDIVMGNIETLTQGFKSWMTEKVDYTRDLYGRNQDKPALLDPGTFKMMNFFRVRPNHEVLAAEVIREPGEELVKYVVAAKLVHYVTGHVLAEGVGSCCTDEKKYQYRWLTQSRLRNEHGYSDEAIEGLPFKEIPGRSGRFKVYRIRNPEILDLDNTILKLAAKRAEMDAALQLPGVAAVFAQEPPDPSERKDVEADYSVKPPDSQVRSPPKAPPKAKKGVNSLAQELTDQIETVMESAGFTKVRVYPYGKRVYVEPLDIEQDEWPTYNAILTPLGAAWNRENGRWEILAEE